MITATCKHKNIRLNDTNLLLNNDHNNLKWLFMIFHLSVCNIRVHTCAFVGYRRKCSLRYAYSWSVTLLFFVKWRLESFVYGPCLLKRSIFKVTQSNAEEAPLNPQGLWCVWLAPKAKPLVWFRQEKHAVRHTLLV